MPGTVQSTTALTNAKSLQPSISSSTQNLPSITATPNLTVASTSSGTPESPIIVTDPTGISKIPITNLPDSKETSTPSKKTLDTGTVAATTHLALTASGSRSSVHCTNPASVQLPSMLLTRPPLNGFLASVVLGSSAGDYKGNEVVVKEEGRKGGEVKDGARMVAENVLGMEKKEEKDDEDDFKPSKKCFRRPSTNNAGPVSVIIIHVVQYLLDI